MNVMNHACYGDFGAGSNEMSRQVAKRVFQRDVFIGPTLPGSPTCYENFSAIVKNFFPYLDLVGCVMRTVPFQPHLGENESRTAEPEQLPDQWLTRAATLVNRTIVQARRK